MKSSLYKYISLGALGSMISLPMATAQTTVYSETFDPAPETETDFNMQLGGNQIPNNTKMFELGQWGTTTNGQILDIGGDNGNVIQPQQDGKNNGRCVGIFLAPNVFASTGAGTYTLEFELIASSAAGAGRVYIGAGKGYDLSENSDAKLNLALSAPGFGVRKNNGEVIWDALTGANGATATHLLTTEMEWVDSDGNETGEFRDTPGLVLDVETSGVQSVEFEYDGTSAIAIAFAGYNTDFQIDNINITSESEGPKPGDSWGGFEIIDGNFVDTGSMLGWLYIGNKPWVWSYQLSQYVYLREQAIGGSGAWMFVGR